jgi:transposase
MTVTLPKTKEECQAICDAGPDAVFALIAGMASQVAALTEANRRLEARVKELEGRRAKDSRNSGKPPSSDGLARKPKSLRTKSGKPSGGQPGHPGKTLSMSDHPDRIVSHLPEECEGCGASLAMTEPSGIERRQIFDLPPIAIEITEHRVESRVCPRCGRVNRGSFPEDATHSTQYGPGVRSLAAYLQVYQFLPYERTCEMMRDLLGVSISEGTLFESIRACSKSLEPTEAAIREAISEAKVAHFDETGLRIEGRTRWLHSASAGAWVHYSAQERRGQEGMKAVGILPEFEGRAVHDGGASYFAFDCDHALCNAHHLRELTYVAESFDQEWANGLKSLLIEMKTVVEAATEAGGIALEAETLRSLEERYDDLLTEGEKANPPLPPSEETKRGRKKGTPAINLLDRLRKHKDQTLAFLRDFAVPFDNNRAERDVRMMKVRQKVSGGFRSWAGAKDFCRIRGYLATARNQSFPVLFALRQVFLGHPLVLASFS